MQGAADSFPLPVDAARPREDDLVPGSLSPHTPSAGGAAPLLATLHGRDAGTGVPERHPIHLPEVLIGRVQGNDLLIPDPSVSARHARLRLSGGVWTVADLGSVNGTTVDGNAVVRAQALAPGSEVAFGSVTLIFEPLDRWEDSPLPAPASLAVASEGDDEEPTSRLPMIVGVLILLASLIGYLLSRAG